MGCCASKPKESSLSSTAGVRNQITKKNFQNRVQNWHATGVVSLRDCSLPRVPPDVISELTEKNIKVKTFDATNNRIVDVPESLLLSIGANLQRVIVKKNKLKRVDAFFAHAKRLKVLDASENAIDSIDWSLLAKQCGKTLKSLNLSRNQLLAVDVGTLGEMEALEDVDVSGNGRLERLSMEASSSSSREDKEEVKQKDLDERKWQSLTTFAATQCDLLSVPDGFLPPKMKTILLDDNPRLSGLPRDLFESCALLLRVSLHRCQAIDVKSIESMPGYSRFAEKVQQSHDKKIKGGVLLGSGYGEDGLDRRGGDDRLGRRSNKVGEI
jgi:hypothetical protein